MKPNTLSTVALAGVALVLTFAPGCAAPGVRPQETPNPSTGEPRDAAQASPAPTRGLHDEEKAYLVSIGDLAEYGVKVEHPAGGETFAVTRNPDGSTRYEYEYDSAADPNSSAAIWLRSEAEIHDTVAAARKAYDEKMKAYRVGAFLADGEAKVRQDPSLFSWGEQCYTGYLEKDASFYGNVVLVRQGRTVFSLLLAGEFIGIPHNLRDLLVPKWGRAATREG